MTPRSLAAVLSMLLVAGAHAGGNTAQDEARTRFDASLAPLTLSADGQWRLHVDAQSVLHRVNLADPAQHRTAALPLPVWLLSASRSGQKVGFVTTTGCVGLVDFGTGAAPSTRTTWQPPPGPDGSAPASWTDALPTECRASVAPWQHRAVALSANGRLLATRREVIDTETHQRVATLPLSDDAYFSPVVLKLRFADRDTKLLVLSGRFGEVDEGLGSPSDLRLAVWDVATHALFNLLSHVDADNDSMHALFSDFSPQTGVFTWVDTRRYRDVLNSGAWNPEKSPPPPYDLVQERPGRCGAPAIVRYPLPSRPDGELVVDPWGRWVAELRPIDDTKPGGDVARLVVTDIDSRRTVSTVALREQLRGLVATPDGATILAQSASDEVRSFEVDVAALSTPKTTAQAWDATPCRIEDEAPGARAPARVTRALAPAWPQARTHATPIDGSGAPFVMRDGTLWLDQGSTIAQLDLSSGKTVRTLPTPRSDKIRSMPVPASDGFFNMQGDTLSWRPFDLARQAVPGKRLVDVRPGWTVDEVRPLARSVRVVWHANEGTPVRTKDGVQGSLAVVLYDAASGRRLREFLQDAGGYDIEDESETAWSTEWLPRCRDDQGATTGTDWRFDALGSLRATRCAPGEATVTTAWFGLDIAPRPLEGAGDDPQRRLTSVDGPLAAAVDQRTVRAFDIDGRRELGQVALGSGQLATWLRVLADARLLLVETCDDNTCPDHATLQAWSLK
ncbi:hypothetical protein [Scleromatobacter humisilvae]|uniref:Uncharacterized protein n=1 Tax=Scleromatobacter humisilvae TaxID=2897159 RepID=A0A9X1YGZ4_9BURK|nr:hypothetical protein [Scleromatobacter humisilvae]MCK9684538.1 hypothetical protein [Scleromatobacter humisilvae]